MIQASWIYAVATVLLALLDAVRILINWGKIQNIDHFISRMLAIFWGAAVAAYWIFILGISTDVKGWVSLVWGVLTTLSFVAVRLAVFDVALNAFRLLFKVNPTLRLDYVSTETSSYEDQHSEKLSFWQKRALAVAAWGIIAFLYCKIFHTL